MKPSKLCFIVAALMVASTLGLYAQQESPPRSEPFIGISAGMGVNALTVTSIVDYINAVAQPRQGQQLDDFTATVEFFLTPEFQIAEEWSAAIEYSLLLKSYALDNRNGFSRSEFDYQVHMPTLLLHRVVLGEGFRLKFGGGVGYHFSKFNQRFPTFGSEDAFTARGFGVKLDAVGHTQFDETFYGNIGVDMRWDFLGPLKSGNGTAAIDRTSSATPKMNFFSIGLKFGVMFHLN